MEIALFVVAGLVLAGAVLTARTQLHRSREEMSRLRAEWERRESRSSERESRLDEEQRRLHACAVEAAETQAVLARQREEIRAQAVVAETEQRLALERAAGLSAAQARAEIVRTAEEQAKREVVRTVREIERRARSEGEARAREIVATAVQRIAAEQTADSVVAVVRLPGDEMKGRIIGREGRNIRSFEAVTGVNLVIDDTPALFAGSMRRVRSSAT